MGVDFIWLVCRVTADEHAAIAPVYMAAPRASPTATSEAALALWQRGGNVLTAAAHPYDVLEPFARAFHEPGRHGPINRLLTYESSPYQVGEPFVHYAWGPRYPPLAALAYAIGPERYRLLPEGWAFLLSPEELSAKGAAFVRALQFDGAERERVIDRGEAWIRDYGAAEGFEETLDLLPEAVTKALAEGRGLVGGCFVVA
ncbi:MAG: hypothetical protein V4850_05255 [Myxococcota bacterium]